MSFALRILDQQPDAVYVGLMRVGTMSMLRMSTMSITSPCFYSVVLPPCKAHCLYFHVAAKLIACICRGGEPDKTGSLLGLTCALLHERGEPWFVGHMRVEGAWRGIGQNRRGKGRNGKERKGKGAAGRGEGLLAGGFCVLKVGLVLHGRMASLRLQASSLLGFLV
eukprot:scaffold204586_cov19-Tisochrysis_lutea.AAC.1